jgi:histidine phosphotransfer protein HptB
LGLILYRRAAAREINDMHLDLETLQELKDVMENEFNLLLLTYLEDSVKRLEAIDAALLSGNSEHVRQAAHSFKGSCGNIGATLLADLCKQLETSGAQGRMQNGPAIAEQIKLEYTTVKGLLQQQMT